MTQVRFNNTAGAPDTTPRVLNVTVNDGGANSNTAVSTLTVVPLPDAVADTVTTNEDTAVGLDPLANDDTGAGTDGVDDVTITTIPLAAEGSLTYTEDGTGNTITVSANDTLSATEAATLVFTPVIDFAGNVTTVAYTLTDANGNTSSATIDITVTPTPDAVNDTVTVNEDSGATAINPLANDDTGAGTDGVDDVTITTAPTAAQGTLTYTQDGTGNTITVSNGETLSAAEAATLQFTPAADFNGTVTIPYTLTDSNGASSGASIIVTVSALNDPPALDLDGNDSTAAGTSYAGTFTEDGGAVAVADADTVITDIDDTDLAGAVVTLTNPQAGDVLSVAGALPGGITAVVNGAGTAGHALSGTASLADYQTALTQVRFNNTAGAPDTTPRVLNVTVNDGGANSNTAVSTLTVVPLPDAVADTVTTNEDTAVGLDPLANDDTGAGTDGVDDVTITTIPLAAEGALTYTEDGTGNTITVSANDTLVVLTEAATLVFTPVTDFAGNVTTVAYTLTDSQR